MAVIAYYAGGPSQLDSFDVKKITQLIYCFGHLQGNRFYLKSAMDTIIIQQMVVLKNKNPALKVTLSLGGWGGCPTCSDVFATEAGRQEFAQSVQEVNNYFHCDGIDLDWEYPTIENFAGQKYAPADKTHFTLLVQQLRKTLGKEAIITFAEGYEYGC